MYEDSPIDANPANANQPLQRNVNIQKIENGFTVNLSVYSYTDYAQNVNKTVYAPDAAGLGAVIADFFAE